MTAERTDETTEVTDETTGATAAERGRGPARRSIAVVLLADLVYLVERLSEPQDRGRSALGSRRRDLTASFV
jgi:hypothetical protein